MASFHFPRGSFAVVIDTEATSGTWLKAELHAHCSVDPRDYKVCAYTPGQLICEAARLGYRVLAITCHNRDIWDRRLSDYAESLGITLIPGMEVSAEGRRHVLAYNFQTGCDNLDTFDKIRARRRVDTLVVAPHSFFPALSCLWGLLEHNLDLFDAIEISGFYTAELNFNGRAAKVAARHGIPMVGNGDVHMLWQLNKTYTWIDSEPGVLPVLQAIREGRVRVESAPLTLAQVTGWWTTSLWRFAFPANPAPKQGNLAPIPIHLNDDL
jgi:predicted metal-dependent phosphoesterase TrpH